MVLLNVGSRIFHLKSLYKFTLKYDYKIISAQFIDNNMYEIIIESNFIFNGSPYKKKFMLGPLIKEDNV